MRESKGILKSKLLCFLETRALEEQFFLFTCERKIAGEEDSHPGHKIVVSFQLISN